jgi:hypothetical protein
MYPSVQTGVAAAGTGARTASAIVATIVTVARRFIEMFSLDLDLGTTGTYPASILAGTALFLLGGENRSG